MDHALELKAWAENDGDDERAMVMRLGAVEIERLRDQLRRLVDMETDRYACASERNAAYEAARKLLNR